MKRLSNVSYKTSFYLSVIERGACSNEDNDEYKKYFARKAHEDNSEEVASNPILLYKLIKKMNWFYDEVYYPKIQSVAANGGIWNNIDYFFEIIPLYII